MTASHARLQILLMTALMLAIAFAGMSFQGFERPPLVSAGLLASFIALSWFDFRHMILPNFLTLPLIATGLVWTWLTGGSWLSVGVGMVIGYGGVVLINMIWQARSNMDGMGLGDGKLLAAAAAWLGGLALAPIVLIASGTALILVLVSGGGRAPNRHKRIPFGPFIALGFWTAWILPIVPQL